MLATAAREMLPATRRVLLRQPVLAALPCWQRGPTERPLLLARSFSARANDNVPVRVPSMYGSLATESSSAGMARGTASQANSRDAELGSWVSPMSMSMDDLAWEEEEDDAEEDGFKELADLVSRVHGRPDLELGSALARLGVTSVRDLENVTENDLTDKGIQSGTARKFIQVVELAMAP
mmetsp:Transcript_3651/g.7360  ORF Transcript_3651/g.7360 Transcript_3651/m.7360 type:complete len:180 (-) Transcript_3651:505-1044(-)